jgi:hypothetical protein
MNITNVQPKTFEFDKGEDIYTFSPEKPFKLQGFLVWNPIGLIKSLRIVDTEQLIGNLALQLFESPFAINEIRMMINNNTLYRYLPCHLQLTLRFPTAPANTRVTTTIDGSFDHIIFWGVEPSDVTRSITTQYEAQIAKVILQAKLGQPNWLRGIGIGNDGQKFFIKVNIDKMSPYVQATLPNEISGVEVRIAIVGNIEAI